MSLPTLYRKIKQYSDLSILELTRNIRLKKAAELLATQQYSVQEVAEMVGFNDTPHSANGLPNNTELHRRNTAFQPEVRQTGEGWPNESMVHPFPDTK